MSCKHWTQYLVYLVFISAFTCSVVLMVYVDFRNLHRAPLPRSRKSFNEGNLSLVAGQDVDISLRHKNVSSSSSIPTESYPGSSVPLMDFKDLGNKKERVLLLITVGSAPQRFDRRQAIRDTWWKHCKQSQVKCVFITDGILEDHAQLNLILQERNRYKDLELQPLPQGVQFGQRFLNSIKWATAKFDFQYLLKLDDDYFVCLKRLLSELPLRPKRNLVWGHFHCEMGITWADEAFVIFSGDMIHKFLAQDENKMLCHPFADQQFSIWLKSMTKVYFHDNRLHHDPPASFLPKFKRIKNVCDSYIGIHGTYVGEMRRFGRNANDGAKEVTTMAKFSTFCPFTRFDHRKFVPKYRFDPKPCIQNPTWNNSRFIGREDERIGYNGTRQKTVRVRVLRKASN